MDSNNDQFLIERGLAAEEILNLPVFATAVSDLLNYYMQSLINSPPDQKDARENAYFQSRAINDVVALMRQWAAIKDQILNSALEENDD